MNLTHPSLKPSDIGTPYRNICNVENCQECFHFPMNYSSLLKCYQ